MQEGQLRKYYGDFNPLWRRAQTHVHTTYSDGNMRPQEVVDLARGVVNDLVITDHDTPAGALVGKEYNADFEARCPDVPELRVWVGQEVVTRWGDLIGFNINETIVCNLPAENAARAIKEQGGITIVPHPAEPMANGMDWEQVDYLFERGLLDGVELANGGVMTLSKVRAYPFMGDRVTKDNTSLQAVREYRKRKSKPAATGGSDGHSRGIGAVRSVVTLYPEDMTLDRAILSGRTAVAMTGETESLDPREILQHKLRTQAILRDRKSGRKSIICVNS